MSSPIVPGAGASPDAPSPFGIILPLIPIVVLFYFLMIRPQEKQQKKTKEMLDALKKGDRVLTSGGLYGWVVGIREKDDVVVLRIAEEVKIEVSRKAISNVVAEADTSMPPADPVTGRS